MAETDNDFFAALASPAPAPRQGGGGGGAASAPVEQTVESLLNGYCVPHDAYDEAVTHDGKPRPHWIPLLQSFAKLGSDEINRRHDRGRQFLEENGVTYNVYTDPRGMDRPWEMDEVPLVVSAEDWRELSAGLEQRARLLDMVLQDLHGPMKLLREGWIPPELVWANPNFLRAVHAQRSIGGVFLHLLGTDLTRGPEGGWWVVGDRTQAPSGAGYALENRMVTARVWPDEYRTSRAERLAPFFARLRQSLAALAPRNRENPRICILTPGPFNETYFEHTFLARYLGYTLVEGGDLSVRDNRLYLKTLAGLQPVDVVLRRLDDGFCDPLELRPESTLGVAGLAQAAAASEVTVANALGSGVVETSALMAFLPGLCKRMLGEDLKLPSVATWWCGEPKVLQHVEAHLHQLIVKPAFPGSGLEPVFGDSLSSKEREELLARIRRTPHNYVAQQPLSLGTVPVWNGTGLEPRRYMLRVFAAAVPDEHRWHVMPGGLTRVGAGAFSRVVSMQRGGCSKDCWILTDGPVAPVSLLPASGTPVELRRGGHDLFSRIADNMYWLGRYVERAEGAVRLLRVMLRASTSELSNVGPAALPTLLDALTHYGIEISVKVPNTTPAYGTPKINGDSIAYQVNSDEPWTRAQQVKFEQDVINLMLGSGRSGNLRHTLKMVRQASRMVRDRLSIDTWRVLSRLEQLFGRAASTGRPTDVLAMLDDLVLHLSALSGLGMESSTRNPGWRFLDLGRRIERAVHTLMLLRRSYCGNATVDERPLLQALLEICDSGMTYRSRYLAALDPVPVLDLLLTDETNPRSVAFQAVALVDHVEHLPRDPTRAILHQEEKLALKLRTTLQMADVHALCTVAPNGRRRALDEFLSGLQDNVPQLNDAISRAYLSVSLPVAPVAQSMVASATPQPDRGDGA